MLDMLTKILSLSGKAKIGAGLAGAVALVAIVAVFSPKLAPILLLGLAVVALALGLYKASLKWSDKRKAKPFERRLAENAGAAPMGVGDAARRARLDDMRRKFEEGVSTFREHGKDLYSLPWYLLVGEPGSGKTEAIRHCNVGFPPGLQDQLQGAGGTLNMNWWFTNHAVILDTAGRLMFEEIEPGKTSEWREFLKLLRAVRPNCPVNGMLLVIPADSLIADTADSIHKKGGRIAEQLDSIQKALGVRFPVFVVITKCDLINGFREFFRDLIDPQMQHQMLGWSNPADLDEPFKPELVEQHLKSVSERLRRRRMGLLLDPVHTEDPIGGRRADEVDALYAFPDALLKIGPRLKMYLETVFVAGEWSSRPLFLRGIYFTSSMQEGAELDAELAEALGVDVKSLPEGKGFTRNSSYFLKDLFVGKVFREKGLVTSATNARRQQRRRRTAVMGAGVLGTLGLMGATVFADRQYKQAIGGPAGFWAQASKVMELPNSEKWEVVVRSGDEYFYEGDQTAGEEGTRLKLGGAELTKAQLAMKTRERAEEQDETPVMFKPIAGVTGGDVFAKELEAHQRVLELTVLEPAVGHAQYRMTRDHETKAPWSAEATGALRQLLRLEAARQGVDQRVEGQAPIEIRPLIDYLDPPEPARDGESEDEKALRVGRGTDLEALQNVIAWTYGPGGAKWPPESRDLNNDYEPDEDPLLLGAARFVEHWKSSPTAQGQRLARLVELKDAAEAFAKAETDLRAQVAFSDVQTVELYESRRTDFNSRFAALQAAKERLDRAVGAVGETSLQGDIRPLVQSAVDEVSAEAVADYKSLTDQLPPPGPEGPAPLDEPLKGVRDRLAAGLQELTTSWTAQRDALAEQLASVNNRQLVRRVEGKQRSYERRYAMFERARARFDAVAGISHATDIFGFGSGLTRAEQAATEALADTNLTPAERQDVDTVEAVTFLQDAVAAAKRRELHDAMQAALGGLGGDRSIGQLVQERSLTYSTAERTLAKPTIPLSNMRGDPFNAQYHPRAAREILEALDGMARGAGAGTGGGGSAPLDAEKVRLAAEAVDDAVKRYCDEYVRYWTETVNGELRPVATTSWATAQGGLAGIAFDPVRRDLVKLAEQCSRALDLPEKFMSSAATAGKADYDAMREALNDPVYVAGASDALSAWAGLPATASGARDRVLQERPEDFKKKYLATAQGVYGEVSSKPRVGYWSAVLEYAVEALAAESESDAVQAWQSIRIERKGFPLCRDAASVLLTDEQARQAFVEVTKIRSQPGAAQADAETLADGARLAGGFDRINGKIERLRGGGVLTSRDDREWVEDRLAPVVAFLRGDGTGAPRLPDWEFVALQQDSNVVKHIMITGAGLREPKPVDNAAEGGETGIRLPVYNAQSLRMEFFDRRRQGADFSGATRAELELSTKWTILGPMLRGEVRTPDETGQPGVWGVPVSLSMGGATVEYIVGVRFINREMTEALLEAWPSSADWPDGQ